MTFEEWWEKRFLEEDAEWDAASIAKAAWQAALASQGPADWSNAPEWAMYKATDAEGAKNWFEVKPFHDSYLGYWRCDEGKCEEIRIDEDHFEPCSNWIESLEERPK